MKLMIKKRGIYIIKCRDNTLYIGMSMNFKQRLNQYKHNHGSKWVKDHGMRSWKFWIAPRLNRSQICQIERYLKKQSTARKHEMYDDPNLIYSVIIEWEWN